MNRNPKCKSRRPALRRAGLLESLENRQLMAAFSANFNFQPSWAPTPAGYVADTGKTFRQQNGFEYGWNTDNSANVFDRYTAGEDRLDTFQTIGQWSASKWEVTVPNGDYRVSLTAGDFSSVTARYVLKAENSTLIDATPSSSNRFINGSGIVTVTDGRLTLTTGGGFNNRVNSISIQSATSTNTGNGAGVLAPAAPSWAGAWSIGDTSLTLGWGDNSNNENGFLIEQSTDGVNYTEVARTGANVGSRNITGLTAGTNYYYRVKSFNAFGTSNASSTITRTTGSATPAGQAPNRPSWVWASPSSSNSATVLWGDTSWNESGFIIRRSTDGQNYTEAGRVGANVSSFNDTGLNANTNYYYKVASYNAAGNAVTNETAAIRTGTGGQAQPAQARPASPSWASSWVTGSTSGSLNWGDASNNETGFIVQRSTDGWNFSEAGRVGANTTTFNATGLNPSTKYYFRVVAYNGAGESGATSANNFTTWAAPQTPVVTAPSTPSFLWGWSTGANSATLEWGNVANENGYRIERSTDGNTFNSVGTVGADTTRYNVTGLAAGTNYTFRVIAYNNGGDSAAARTTVATNGTTNNNGGNNNNGGGSTVMNKASLRGMVMNEVPANVAIPALRELGMTHVRLWYGLDNWYSGPNQWALNRAQEFKNAGFTVVLAIVAKQQTDYGTAKSYFQRLAADPKARQVIDFWELGNEPNMPQYWNGSLQSFVQNFMRPAYEEIKKYANEPVIGGGISWDVNAVRTLVQHGYNNYCDYGGFHPYGESGAIVTQRARDARAAMNNKPMIITEWNVQFITDQNRWAAENNIAAAGLSQIAEMNYYFALAVNNSHVGQGGVIYTNGSKNWTFWNSVSSWTR